MSLKYSMEIKGLDTLLRDVRQAKGNADPLVRAAIANSTNRIQALARAKAPHRTGTLQRSIMTEVLFDNGRVYVGEKYGIFFEMGTGIYGPMRRRITPKSAKVLAWREGGSMVFAKSVRGIPKQPFFRPAIDEAKPYVNNQFENVRNILVRELAGRK